MYTQMYIHTHTHTHTHTLAAFIGHTVETVSINIEVFSYIIGQ